MPVAKLKPLVAIVGRPNVGKSTFFNRVIGEKVAIVEDVPGTTRDRLYGDGEWNGRFFTMIDTGGLDFEFEHGTVGAIGGDKPFSQTRDPDADPGDVIAAQTRSQAQAAIDEADVILFMVDAKEGMTSTDREIAEILRRTHKPVILAANRADSEERRLNAVEFYDLGLGDPIPISSYHGTNTGDLLDQIADALPIVEEEEEEDGIRIAIIGRPNVGKSRLLNAILGQERVIVSDVPGTTRDAIDTEIIVNGQKVVLIDTAGIRRRGSIEYGIERYSVIRSMRAMSRANVVLLVVDASEGLTNQDEHIAGYALDQMRGLVLVVNKWDKVEKDAQTLTDYTRNIRERLNYLHFVPMIFISAKYGQRVNKVVEMALKVAEERKKRVATAALNKMVREAIADHAPPAKPGKSLKIYYATQADIEPPTFLFSVNDAENVHFAYKRFLENRIRAMAGFEGTPVRLVFRSRSDE